MECTREVTEDIYWVGGNDRRLGLFENIHPVPQGVSYNSYLISDDKTCLMDTCDWAVGLGFIENLEAALNGRELDVMVIDHMEPDHAATMNEILIRWPDVEIYCTMMASRMYKQYGYKGIENLHTVSEGETLSLGKHELEFHLAPMVHWPEVMVTYDKSTGILFSADAFGAFGALNGALFADEMKIDDEWFAEARRYYGNICGKYGIQVQNLLNKAKALDNLSMICPLHGPVWRVPKKIEWLIGKYSKWATYQPEDHEVVIFYSTVYSGTENAAEVLANTLGDLKVRNIRMYDVSVTDVSYLVAEAFRASHLVFAATTYNNDLFPAMEHLIADLKAHNLQNRTVAVLENGSWAPVAGKKMLEQFSAMKNMTILGQTVTMKSTVKEAQREQIVALAEEIAASVEAADKH